MQFSLRAHQMLALTNLHAQRLGHDHVSSEHFLLGALALGEGIGPGILFSAGLGKEQLRAHLANVGPTDEAVSNTYGVSGGRVFEGAARHAANLGHAQLQAEDMILALLDETDGGASRAMAHFGVDRVATRQLLFQKISDESAV